MRKIGEYGFCTWHFAPKNVYSKKLSYNTHKYKLEQIFSSAYFFNFHANCAALWFSSSSSANSDCSLIFQIWMKKVQANLWLLIRSLKTTEGHVEFYEYEYDFFHMWILLWSIWWISALKARKDLANSNLTYLNPNL